MGAAPSSIFRRRLPLASLDTNRASPHTILMCAAQKFQSPKGTRDFYPDAMAVRRYIEDVWRRVSIRHGFLEVDGPTFESLDLYKVKSGDEIVSQLFHFQDRGERALALRPEFTPTLARMVAERAGTLPRPIKWFSIPRCYRAEQPQKGRLREFIQWNVDIVGDGSPQADVEVMALCVDALREFGLTELDIKLRWNHRESLSNALTESVTTADRIPAMFSILDRVYKLRPEDRLNLYIDQRCTDAERNFLEAIVEFQKEQEKSTNVPLPENPGTLLYLITNTFNKDRQETRESLKAAQLEDFCRPDLSIVRGLAYYTGLVFEVFDTAGENRAIAGGGRYDNLIELFGGPALPAVGFGMGDVVLENLLREKNLLPLQLQPRPDVFVVNALPDNTLATKLLAELRTTQWEIVEDKRQMKISRPGLIALTSYKTTKNIGKLLQDAAASNARFALILAPDEVARNVAILKNLQTRQESEIPLVEIGRQIRERLSEIMPRD